MIAGMEQFLSFWVFYVKLFKWLGIIWFQKDFDKTINSQNYFVISVFYYQKEKNKTKKNKIF
ncbi:hypothetical protein ['Camptotheca acuminata' phytoplasma]|uniref:hypothetical protein n=1 Tax='Camptotheca acuminata' phytoplasma TaxID=3239192 RepID=UPI00351A74FB